MPKASTTRKKSAESRTEQIVGYLTSQEYEQAMNLVGPAGSGKPYRSQSEVVAAGVRSLVAAMKLVTINQTP